MKPRIHKLNCLPAALLTLAVAGPLSLPAAPAAPPATKDIPQSVFTYPNNPSEGRDPFFPESMRVYGRDNNNHNQNPAPSLSDLTLKGILGTPPHALAVVNNHTFAVGDEGDVTTGSGQRIHVRCDAINPENNTVTIDVGGISMVLHLSTQP